MFQATGFDDEDLYKCYQYKAPGEVSFTGLGYLIAVSKEGLFGKRYSLWKMELVA